MNAYHGLIQDGHHSYINELSDKYFKRAAIEILNVLDDNDEGSETSDVIEEEDSESSSDSNDSGEAKWVVNYLVKSSLYWTIKTHCPFSN